MDLRPEISPLKTERLDASKPAHIARAAEILRNGGTVAFPTETVYGLGANALSPEAVEKIFVAKQRPHWDPLIVHIANKEMLALVWDGLGAPSFQSHRKGGVSSEARPFSSIAPQNRHPERSLARTSRQAESKSLSRAERGNPDADSPTSTVEPFPTSNSSALASRYPEASASGLSGSQKDSGLQPLGYAFSSIHALIEKFWPGPLTLLLPRTSAIPDAVTAGRPLVGVRMPAHPVALELIRQTGLPIAAPSANTFGHTSPTTAAHVLADLDGRIDAVLDGGPTTVGLESTVAALEVDRRFANLVIFRPGAITAAMLSEVAGVRACHLGAPGLASETWEGTTSISAEGRQSQPSPGLDLRHYAPRARLILIDESLEKIESALVAAIDQACNGTETIGVLLPDRWNPSRAQLIYPWGDWSDGETLARRLFAGLRELDDRGATLIITPIPTNDGIGEAIRDRLQKAAYP